MAISVVTFTSGKTKCRTSFSIAGGFHPDDILPMNIFGLMRFAIFCFATIAVTSAAVEAGASGDVFTPVIASTLSPETHAVRGTDKAYHIIYELQLTNTRPLPATIRSIDVLEAPNASKLITSFSGPDVVKRMRTLAPAPAADSKIGPNEVRLVHGDLSDVHNYTCYGAEVLAVADGKVVGMLNDLDDQKPGKLPDPDTMTIDTVDGNHVVLDIGGGYFAFYAHLQKKSVKVRVGDQVKKGTVLGKLGNSGNSSGPHLHFHVMTGPSVLGSDGVPYVIESFNLAGQIDIAAFEAAPDLTGNWGKGGLSKPERHECEFPLNLNIIDFPPAQNSR